MRIALINGSPKFKESSSGDLLNDLSEIIENKAELIKVDMHKSTLSASEIETLSKADAWVFAYPLYVDGVPGHLLSCLIELEKAQIGNSDIRIYGIVNSGFYEGIQNRLSLKVLQNWCAKSGFTWGGGIGVGGGGSLLYFPKIKGGKGPKAHIYKALISLSEKILNRESCENSYVTVALPRFAYKFAAQSGWRSQIKANGGTTKDLGNIPE